MRVCSRRSGYYTREAKGSAAASKNPSLRTNRSLSSLLQRAEIGLRIIGFKCRARARESGVSPILAFSIKMRWWRRKEANMCVEHEWWTTVYDCVFSRLPPLCGEHVHQLFFLANARRKKGGRERVLKRRRELIRAVCIPGRVEVRATKTTERRLQCRALRPVRAGRRFQNRHIIDIKYCFIDQ